MNNNNKSTSVYKGIVFSGLLQIVFIVLKLRGVIDWSWFLVLSPIWIGIILFVVLIVICCLIISKIE